VGSSGDVAWGFGTFPPSSPGGGAECGNWAGAGIRLHGRCKGKERSGVKVWRWDKDRG
jgi:hypothetical protein